MLKAHGHTPVWAGPGALAPESLEAYKRINLHFHDLRHEAGSRWVEARWPLHHVKDMLGHASVQTTDTYLNSTPLGLHDSMARFGSKPCKAVAKKGKRGPRPLCKPEAPFATNLMVN